MKTPENQLIKILITFNPWWRNDHIGEAPS